MDYLTHGKCSGECGDEHRFKFGNLVIESTEKSYPPSEPKKEDYVWIDYDWDPNKCEDTKTGDCLYSYNCKSCGKGYPVGDPDTHYSHDY
mmetsp:Transcript_17397/g.23450  ORF Transcript_17397/g.23450 Transcript_17397/m.23450 type:complete len:90 (+) Transcript_17397:849-1118(+)